MKRAAKLKKLVAVHAESETLTQKLAAEKIAAGKISIRDYLNSRPVVAELEAIRRAIDLAGETGCALHIVHVSSGAGVALIATAKKSGADVSCETCPHYLVLTETDVEKLGAIAKCAPPLRPQFEQTKLWEHLLAGNVTTAGSDHSPAPPEMKTDKNFFRVWGGISGVQHTLPLLLTEGCVNRQATLSLIAKMTSFNMAERFCLPKTKGRIEIGADADFAFVDVREKISVKTDDLFYRHKQSPYIGRALTGRVVQTILRGRTIFKNGQIIGESQGWLIKTFMNPKLGLTRNVIKRNYALITSDGHVASVIPDWTNCTPFVLISAALGAGLSQFLISLDAKSVGVGETQNDEWFLFVVAGKLKVNGVALAEGGFAFLPPGTNYDVRGAAKKTQLLVFKKTRESLGQTTPEFFTGNEKEIPEVPFLGDKHARLKTLIPDSLATDMAVNIFTYDPGATLPFVETHVMEHGMLFLNGGGVYRLDADWHPVTAGDVIWIAPYCPQWFIAAGPQPARYIYYKNVNRLPR